MSEKQKQSLLRSSIVLMLLTIVAPVTLQIVMEQLMGPGSSVSGGKLAITLLPIQAILASMALQNTQKALKMVTPKADS